MPQADSEVPQACHVSDGRITCETLADELRDQDIPESTIVDFAPESFDWFDHNAFLDRKESIKGNSNYSIHLNPIVTPKNGNASSLQISFLNSKAVVKTNNNIDSKRRNCKLKNILLFPKRSDSIGKEPAVHSMTEPASPKVSCLGRVRSKNCPRRRKVSRPVVEPEKVVSRRKTGFMCCVRFLCRSGCNGSSEYSVPGRNNVTVVGRTEDLR